ncbi:Putative transmembrane permease protein [Deinococcus gobiensis I-0]|uniref:Putative transmembrane permease protein n=1 Tax=Deinococcus gobiensis (strain DSM 21396 / JCM 16679 / CGMCC 1.7299 / I-0) TaxID=745776 RepID=H8GSX0_DEIGI|nr:Putative transmembrane permease protein [Deinococcus gobiensis I-0]
MGLLDREHSVAGPGWSRWLVPPAALAVHLSIGQIYGYSVFNKPLTRQIGGDLTAATGAAGDWSLFQVGLIFSVALFFLGASSALFGKWVEREGPRKTMFTSALLFCGGFFVAALGVKLHSLPLIIFGNGVLGGIGLGLGYISPVSTLIKWFPDRPGLATGMAIMGFGGGALIGSPLGTALMNRFAGDGTLGVGTTFLIMGAAYLVFMIFGAFLVRVPAEGWRPAGWTPPVTQANAMISSHNVLVDQAFRTPQFWLLFAVLFLNVTAGIGVLGQASVMIQEMFSDAVRGAGLGVTAAAAAGFVGLLSIFNMAGRFFWSSTSDRIGRKPTYMVFFALGAVLYFLIPLFGRLGNLPLFVLCFAVIISMYGGGFATIPAYLRDLFGTANVGAIHGRLLLAWSAAAIVGPSLLNGFRDRQIAAGVPAAQAYSTVMYIMAALLVLGFVANLMVRPVASRFWADHNPAPAGAVSADD